ncbi:MAG: hypothetical protein DWP97_07725 [Calditrichaeota bacterium]|nr:MAG: hypothetical protein DWP97_07725 [Calditrichota bacterium]
MATKNNKSNANSHDELKWPYGKKNYIFFGIAMIVIIIGFFLLGSGDITMAPILLVLGYLVLIPVALLVKDKPEEQTETAESE